MSTDDKAAHIRRLLDTEGDSVQANTRVFNQGRYAATEDLEDYEELKDRAREIKEEAISRLPELIEELTEAVEENGGHVYLASDAADANRYITEVADDAETLVKSKSMTSEEIDVNEALEATGVDVYETDLGEFVIQVAEESPSHIVGPAIHKSREEIAELFNREFETDEPLETAEELTMFAREYLGERVKEADVGMTGANFLVAESGTMLLVTSEGNARKCAVAPDTHIAVSGVEKVLPNFEDLQPFIELIARSGTGQDLTSYMSLLTPPVSTPTIEFGSDAPLSEADGDRDFHLVLIDNGRMAMREDPELRETLYCIRCGACANVCANFQHVGGHAFGGETYSGGIATGWEAGVHGQESAGEFNDLCTGCSRCVNQCPVKIDIPWINEVVRDRINRGEAPSEFDFLVEGLTPDAEPGGVSLQKRFFGNFGTVAKLGSKTAPVSNWLAELPPSRWAMEKVLQIDRRRDLPKFADETLQEWFLAREGLSPTEADREAVLYPDTYTNYISPERGKAAVRTLESLGVRVLLPDLPESGRAPLSQGMLSTAREQAHETYAGLAEHLDAGRDVIAIEPSDLAMFRGEYEKFLPEASFDRLSAASYEICEYVYGLVTNDPEKTDVLTEGPGRVAYHSHCQQRTMGLGEYTETLLEDLNYDVLTSTVECCGMAGSFGYKEQYYELSMDVGYELEDEFEAAGQRDRTVLASGTSCTDQLDVLLERKPHHPIELIAPDLG
ncbi:lactate utilization protein B [Halalkalicoccus paucihalophilus]|uniref:Lactate utilization protein B n=1 Tax=Halalkalicoccus paucihalophilus TaxID=1008153 RepID=A0A151ACT7_9EURY|nr:LUD domain-containing protein [Halalkalicoccus paucihalophilus]KYH25433.1 lactate utilization protein B [Halalkalicoccus paucihalophilus]